MADEISDPMQQISDVYRVHPGEDGSETKHQLIGRLWDHGGKPEVLADYQGLLGGVKSIDRLKRNPYLRVVTRADMRDGLHPDLLPEAEIPSAENEHGVVENQPRPPSVFTYHHPIMQQPQTLEARDGNLYMNGGLLSRIEAHRIMDNIHQKIAQVRYKPVDDTGAAIQKMAADFEILAKAQDLKPEEAQRVIQDQFLDQGARFAQQHPHNKPDPHGLGEAPDIEGKMSRRQYNQARAFAHNPESIKPRDSGYEHLDWEPTAQTNAIERRRAGERGIDPNKSTFWREAMKPSTQLPSGPEWNRLQALAAAAPITGKVEHEEPHALNPDLATELDAKLSTQKSKTGSYWPSMPATAYWDYSHYQSPEDQQAGNMLVVRHQPTVHDDQMHAFRISPDGHVVPDQWWWGGYPNGWADPEQRIRQSLSERTRNMPKDVIGAITNHGRWINHQDRAGAGPWAEKWYKTEREFENLKKIAPDLAEKLSFLVNAERQGHVPAGTHRTIARELFVDPMTGTVGNKAAWKDFLTRPRGGVHMMADLNNFKSINDIHGHEKGDEAIKAAVRALTEARDLSGGTKYIKLFRPSGDELAGHFDTPERAALFARNFRARMEAIPPVGGTHNLSASIGFGPSALHADQAMYKAKAAKTAMKYQPGQAKTHVHSLIPGHEGPVPVEKDPHPLSSLKEAQPPGSSSPAPVAVTNPSGE